MFVSWFQILTYKNNHFLFQFHLFLFWWLNAKKFNVIIYLLDKLLYNVLIQNVHDCFRSNTGYLPQRHFYNRSAIIHSSFFQFTSFDQPHYSGRYFFYPCFFFYPFVFQREIPVGIFFYAMYWNQQETFK